MTVSAPSPDWRDEAPYDAIVALGRDALAWEVLRRNPAYQRFVAQPCKFGAVADWGLHFP
jgi:hypothetical protein